MEKHDYTDQDFRLYIKDQVAELKAELDEMARCARVVARYPDRVSVECAVSALFNSERWIRAPISKLHRELYYDSNREHLPRQREKLAQSVSRLRRRREREAKLKS
jgi:hypothetical protein